jgi:2-(1,2-epoxy-1,2-dihydrophenyl)acetyl-CoA isomerase
MLGETLSSSQAREMGLVNRVVPVEDLEAEVKALAQRLASGPTVAYGRLRRLMRESFDRDLPGQLAAEAAAFVHCAETEDFKTGVDAFFTKQTARFIGR